MLHNGTCQSTCPSGTFTRGIYCVQCDSSCQECTEHELNCTECPTGKFLLHHECQDFCPFGSFENTALKTCQKCPLDCQKCQNATTCLQCKEGYHPNNIGACVVDDPCTGGYLFEASICQKCDDNCLTCNITSDRCLTCYPNMYRLPTTQTCVADCPQKYRNHQVGDIYDWVCESCQSTGCLKCDAIASICTECESGYFLDGNVCVTECGSTKVGNKLTNTCEARCPVNYYPRRFSSSKYECYECNANCSLCIDN